MNGILQDFQLGDFLFEPEDFFLGVNLTFFEKVNGFGRFFH